MAIPYQSEGLIASLLRFPIHHVNFPNHSNDTPLCSIGHIHEIGLQRQRENQRVPG